MSNRPSDDRTDFNRRIHAEMLDSFDEELEMEVDDDRMNYLIAESSVPADQEMDESRHFYFKELFRLQGELVKLQDWVVH
ncbi:MAG: polyphosphate kinase, partial [Pseudomonadota bacterium]|nr:polyphosphate kinase [Pseudomonadota bacterium]